MIEIQGLGMHKDVFCVDSDILPHKYIYTRYCAIMLGTNAENVHVVMWLLLWV